MARGPLAHSYPTRPFIMENISDVGIVISLHRLTLVLRINVFRNVLWRRTDPGWGFFCLLYVDLYYLKTWFLIQRIVFTHVEWHWSQICIYHFIVKNIHIVKVCRSTIMTSVTRWNSIHRHLATVCFTVL